MDTPTAHLTLVNNEPPHRTRRQRLAARLRRLRRPSWLRVPDWARQPGNWIAGLIVAAALGVVLTVVAGVGWLLVTIITGIGDALSAAGHGIGDTATGFGHWITHGPITHAVSDPVRAYLQQHSTGLSATGRDLWILWLVTATVLYVAALTGSKYGRYGWAVIGALTAAAAWHGTTTASSRPTAGAVTVAVWLVLSLLAYARVMYMPSMTRTEIVAALARSRVRHAPRSDDNLVTEGA